MSTFTGPPRTTGTGPPCCSVAKRTITSWDRAGDTLAFVASTAVTLGEVFVGMSGQRLTSFSEAFAG